MTLLEWSEVVRNGGLVIGGGIGLGIAIWRALAADRQSRAQKDQVAQARREHAAELFGTAVANLDNEKLHIRLGAIYTLREIVNAYPDQASAVIDLLESYLKDPSNVYEGEPPADVQAILALLLPRVTRNVR